MKNTEISDIKKENFQRGQRIAAIVICAAIGIAFLFCYIRYGKQLYSVFGSTDSLKAFLARFNGYDELAFVAIRAFQTVIKIIPAEPLEIASGVFYGTWKGLLFCMLGTEIGSLVIILLSRIFGRKLVNLFFPIEKIDSLKFLQNRKRAYFSLFFIYLIPGTPKDVLTYVASITNLNMPLFLLVTGIARIPSIITSTLCGEQIINKNYTLAIIIFAATGLAGIVSSVIYQKLSEKKDSKDSQEEP